MSKAGRINAELSDENFEFFDAEQKRRGVKSSTAMLNFLLAELRELRTELRKSTQNPTHSLPRK